MRASTADMGYVMRTAPWTTPLDATGTATYSRSVPSVRDVRRAGRDLAAEGRPISDRDEKSRLCVGAVSTSARPRRRRRARGRPCRRRSRRRRVAPVRAPAFRARARPRRGSRARRRRARPCRSAHAARSRRRRSRAGSRGARARAPRRRGSWRGAGVSRLRCEPEPDAAHRLDPAWVAELLPQRRDVDVDVFVGPNHSVFQTSRSMPLAARSTAPGSDASSASRSNSFVVSASSRPSSVHGGRGCRPRACPARSTSSSPRGVVRRMTARMRARSSRKPNGLTT